MLTFIPNQSSDKRLALSLLDWHGGQSSGLYSVGSTLLSCSEKGREFNVTEMLPSLRRAIRELRNLRAEANFPECVTDVDEDECNKLAEKLEYLSR